MDKAPNSRANLDKAIQRLYGTGAKYLEIRAMIANTIIGQFLSEGVVKGGSALRFRYGLDHTRMTVDFDTAHRNPIEDFIETLASGLKAGWSGFTGEIVRRSPAKPRDIPPQYVMQPFDVKLLYLRRPWCTVRLEVGYDEIGDAQIAENFVSDEIADMFKSLCLDLPNPIPLMPLAHQVAQKLHGVTDPNSDRAHDLVDLQLIYNHGEVKAQEVHRIAVRLFANRHRQPWPPKVLKKATWEELYLDAKGDLPVLPTVDEAIAWANELIARIDKA